MKTKILIGIPAWSVGPESFGVQKTYLEYFSQFGQVEILTPNVDIRTDLDLVVLPGGQDVQTTHYPTNTPPGFMNSLSDPFKDYFFKNNLPKYIENGTPILGICLGEQQLALHFGVPLIQNISGMHGYSDDGDDLKNTCVVNKEVLTMLGLNSARKEVKVNSFHHQAVSLENLNNYGKGTLLPLLVDKDTVYDDRNGSYQIVECFVHAELPIIGIQSHPEKTTWCPFSAQLVRYLLSKSKNIKNEVKDNIEQVITA